MAENTVRVRVAVAAALLLLAGCDERREVAQDPESPNRVSLVAVAPDGTHLWVTSGGVYFASSGAQYKRSCGKSCVRTEIVPTAPTEPEVAARVGGEA